MELITTPHFEAADDFYAALVDCHRDLSAEQSHALNARLVLLLANHVGSQQALLQALAFALAAADTVRLPEAGASSGADA